MNNESITKVLDDILELRESILAVFVPAEARLHFRLSQKEALLGVRAAVDHAISRFDERTIDGKQRGNNDVRTVEITE